jgi:hypothetical protein
LAIAIANAALTTSSERSGRFLWEVARVASVSGGIWFQV